MPDRYGENTREWMIMYSDIEMDKEWHTTACIGVCTLEDDVCIGCNRTMDEIREAYIESMRRDSHIIP